MLIVLIILIVLFLIYVFRDSFKGITENYTSYTAKPGYYPFTDVAKRVYVRIMPERSDIPYNGMYTIRGSKQY